MFIYCHHFLVQMIQYAHSSCCMQYLDVVSRFYSSWCVFLKLTIQHNKQSNHLSGGDKSTKVYEIKDACKVKAQRGRGGWSAKAQHCFLVLLWNFLSKRVEAPWEEQPLRDDFFQPFWPLSSTHPPLPGTGSRRQGRTPLSCPQSRSFLP